MRSLLPLFVVLTLACAPLPATGTRPDASVDAGSLPLADAGPAPVRIGTLNTHRLFDTTCDTGQCGPGDYEEQPTPEAFAAHVDAIAAGIREMGVDVVLLQEVETQASLDALHAKLADLYPVAVLGEIGAPASVDVAVLARGTLTQVITHREVPLVRPDGTGTYFSREFLEVQLALDGRPVIVFAAHFRSKVSDDPGRRLAEAQAAHALVSARASASPQALVVMGGDLNDVPGSPPLDALLSDGQLVRVAEELRAGDSTYDFHGDLQAIDHLLWAHLAGGAYVPGSARVWGVPAAGFAGSDHAALSAGFTPP